MKITDRKFAQPESAQFRWYNPSSWSFKLSEKLNRAFRIGPLVLIILIGSWLGNIGTSKSDSLADKLIADHGSDNKAAMDKAYTAYAGGDYIGALSLANAIVENDLENAMAHQIIGLSFARRGLLEEAFLHLHTATRLDPTFALAWYNLGVVLEYQGELASSLEVYRKAVDLEPGNSTFTDACKRVDEIITGVCDQEREQIEMERLFSEGLEAVDRGTPADMEYAESIFKTLLKQRPDDIATLNLLGMAYARMGKLEEAECSFLKVVMSEPGYSDAWFNLGIVHRSQGKLTEAVADFETARASSSIENFRKKAQHEIEETGIMIASGLH